MARGFSKQIHLIREMDSVEISIIAHNTGARGLKCRRYELTTNKDDLELYEVVDRAIDAGITADEIRKFITSASREKSLHKGIA